MLGIFSKLLDINRREVERLSKIVEKVNSFDAKAKKLKEGDFAKKTQEFKDRLGKGETLEQILPEAYAVVREASLRAAVNLSWASGRGMSFRYKLFTRSLIPLTLPRLHHPHSTR